MFRKLLMVGAAALAISGAASEARAGAIVANQWYTFGFNPVVGSAIFGNCGGCTLGTNPASVLAPSTPWTYTGSGHFIITDGFLSGDQFEIFDNLAALGTTSAPTLGADCGANITACLANPNLSHGDFALAAGAHSFTGTVVATEGQSGAAFFEIKAVPEPAGLAVLGAGLLGLGLVRRRKKG